MRVFPAPPLSDEVRVERSCYHEVSISTPPAAFIAVPYRGRFHETAARAFGDSQSERNFCEVWKPT